LCLYIPRILLLSFVGEEISSFPLVDLHQVSIVLD
jgi:hypothetical protein